MASIQSQIKLNDAMSDVLYKINNALLICINSFESLQGASNSSVNIKELKEAELKLIEIKGALSDEVKGQREVNDELYKNDKLLKRSLDKVSRLATEYLNVRNAVNFVKGGIEAAFEAQNINTQLAVSLKNTGLGKDAYDQIQNAAKEYGMFTQTSMAAAGAEFSTYMSDVGAIESMMGTLSDYAVGMAVTEGLDLSTVDIAGYATQLGKVLNGSFDGIAEKGFTVTDAQKAILERGTDMEKAAVVADIINESWAGMYESMSNTPEGKLVTLKNTINQMKEDMGTALIPVVMQIVDVVQANLPTIQQLINGVGSAASTIIPILADILNGVLGVAKFFVDNWSWIGPIVWGIVAALLTYYGIMLAVNTVETISNGIKAVSAAREALKTEETLAGAAAAKTATGAQVGLNAALLACPITWILLIIIAVIAAIYLVIGVINKVTGKSISATGVIAGAVSAAVVFICNLFFGLLELVLGIINYLVNPIISFVNFFANVFNDPIGSIIHLFGDLADNVLGVIQKIASALDFVFGSSMADTVQGWRDSLNEKVELTAKEYGNGQYEEVMSALDLSVEDLGLKRIAYSDAYKAGYSIGESLGSSSAAEDILSIEDILAGTKDIGEDTDSIAGSLKDSEEDLKYLRDIAEQEAINRFTTAEVKIDMTGMTNRIDSNVDLDGVLTVFTEGFAEALEIAAEGVHA